MYAHLLVLHHVFQLDGEEEGRKRKNLVGNLVLVSWEVAQVALARLPLASHRVMKRRLLEGCSFPSQLTMMWLKCTTSK